MNANATLRAPERAPRTKSAPRSNGLLVPKAPQSKLLLPRRVAAANAGVPIRQMLSSRHALHVKGSVCKPVIDYDRPGTDDDTDPFAEADFLLGKRVYRDELIRRVDPFGRDYYWIGGEVPSGRSDERGTDIWAVTHNLVSITPILMDLTNHTLIEKVQDWGLAP